MDSRTDITNNFVAVMDLENLEVGWFHFAAGVAPAAFTKRLRTLNGIPPERGRPIRPTGRIAISTIPTAKARPKLAGACE